MMNRALLALVVVSAFCANGCYAGRRFERCFGQFLGHVPFLASGGDVRQASPCLRRITPIITDEILRFSDAPRGIRNLQVIGAINRARDAVRTCIENVPNGIRLFRILRDLNDLFGEATRECLNRD